MKKYNMTGIKARERMHELSKQIREQCAMQDLCSNFTKKQ